MDKIDIENKVKEILAEMLAIDVNKINPASSLKNDLGMDSFDAIEVGFRLEDEFTMDIPENDFATVDKVQDVVEYIVMRLESKKEAKG